MTATTVLPALTHDCVGHAIAAVHNSRSWLAVRYLYEFIALTATSCREASTATWNEFDIPNRLWTIPSNRTSSRLERHIPLVARVLTILDELKPLGSTRLVFPSAYGQPLSHTTVAGAIRRQGIKAPPLALRHAFRDWCEATDVEREILEPALGRIPRGSADSAPQDTLTLARRRVLMERWAAHLEAQLRSLAEALPNDGEC